MKPLITPKGYNEVPMTVGAIGYSNPTRWICSVYGNLLNAYNITSRVSVNINLSSIDDIKIKLKSIYDLRDRGIILLDDVSELEERVRTESNLVNTSNDKQSMVAVSEIDIKEGTDYKEVTVFRDGKPCKVRKRKKKGISTDAQKRAAENARKYAHTNEANAKRRKSISARRDSKILGEI